MADLPGLCAVAGAVHPSLPERPEVFARKLELFPRGCRAFAGGERLLGYAIAHPWRLFSVPPLDGMLAVLPAEPDCLFIHDVALLPAVRGAGASLEYLDYAAGLARALGLPALALVSVYGTHALWGRHGFKDDCGAAAAKLAAYGRGARYMVRRLAA